VQTGAILAVCWEYRAKLGAVAAGLGHDPAARRFVANLAIAFLPLAILGLAFGKAIKAHLFQPIPVALAFIAGAFVILWAERRRHVVRVHSVDDLGWKDALKLGFAQAFALIPGTSRSGATIIGGLLFGLSRKAATEFSFFLAIPTLFARQRLPAVEGAGAAQCRRPSACGRSASSPPSSPAFLCVRWLLRYISTHDFTVFAWYRIAFGLVVLGTAYTGVVNWTAQS
jgi:undecaprenyl-diphosphatase